MISREQCYSTLNQVMAEPLETPPNAGSLWQGVKHGDMLRAFQKEFKSRGMNQGCFRVDLSRNGADLAAGWTVDEYPGWVKGISAGFGLFTSNASREAMCFYAGLVEQSTDTPLVVDVIKGWRHIKGMDMPAEVKRVVDEWENILPYATIQLDKFRHQILDKREVALILMTAGRRKVIPWSHVGRIDYEWSKQSPNAWGLLRAFWKSVKRCPAQDQLGRAVRFTKMLSLGAKKLTQDVS